MGQAGSTVMRARFERFFLDTKQGWFLWGDVGCSYHTLCDAAEVSKARLVEVA